MSERTEISFDARFCSFNGIAQLVIASSCCIHTFLHFFNAADFMLL